LEYGNEGQTGYFSPHPTAEFSEVQQKLNTSKSQKQLNRQPGSFKLSAKSRAGLQRQFSGEKKSSDPRYQIWSNVKESILRKDSTTGVLHTPFAKKKEPQNDRFIPMSNNYFKKKPGLSIAVDTARERTHSEKNSTKVTFDLDALTGDKSLQGKLKERGFVLKIPKGVRINGRNHNEFYAKAKALRRFSTVLSFRDFKKKPTMMQDIKDMFCNSVKSMDSLGDSMVEKC
jgi:hypothetical protein